MESTGPLAIGLDLGGSKVVGGVVDRHGAVVERIGIRPAQADTQREVLDFVLDVVAGARRRHAIDGIGIGVAGLVDWPQGRVRWSFRTGYDGMELRRLVADATGLPVTVDNDANAAAWGEAHPPGGGVGPDEYLAMLCVGSGLGAGFVLGGEVYRGATGLAAEIGHLPVDSGSTELCGCGCGLAGGLATLASGPAIARAAQRVAAADPQGLIARLSGGRQDDGRGRPEEGGGAAAITSLVAAQAARAGDPAALELFARLGQWLGAGAWVLATLLDVRRIVVGGGLVAAGDLFLDEMRETMMRRTFAREHREPPSIEPARLGADAGWIGAGLLALNARGPTGREAGPAA